MGDVIDRAIDAAEAKSHAEASPEVVGIGLPCMTEALVLEANGGIRFNQLEQHADAPRLMILDVDAGAWRPVMLAPGNWTLQPEGAQVAPKPKIWTP